MPDAAIMFPRISREVIEEMECDLNNQNFAHAVRFKIEQPVLFDFVVGTFPVRDIAVMIAAMGYIYEALQRQMGRGA